MISYLTELNDFESNNKLTKYEMARARKNIIALHEVTVTTIGEDLSVEKQVSGRLTL